MHNSSTKSHSQSSFDRQYNQQCLSTEFRSFNKIYELQSIIIKLLIEKDKDKITYTNSINQINSLSSELQKQINDQKSKIKQKDRSIEGLNMLVQEQRNKITKIQAERDELQKILDSVPDEKNNSLSVNLLVAGYSKVKVDTSNKQAQIKTLTNQNEILASKILEMKAENKSIKENYEEGIRIMKQKMDKETDMYRQQMRKQKQEYSQSIGKCMKCIGEQRQQIRQIKSENCVMEKKMQSYKLTIHRMYQQELQNEILRADQNNENKYGQVNQQSKMMSKLEQIKQNYNTLLEQNQRVTEDNVIKLGQIVHLRSLIDKYTSQIEFLKIQLNNTKQIQFKMQSYMIKLQSQHLNKPSQNQSKSHLDKLQQLLLQYSTEKNKFESKLSQSTKINSHLESRLQQKQQQEKSMQQRIITLQETIQTLQKTNKNLTSKISKIQNQNSSLKLEGEKLALKGHELQIKLHQSSTGKSSANMMQISSQKYHNLKQGILVLGAEKTRLIKQNISVRAEMQQIQQSMVKRIKEFNTLSFELLESKKKQSKWKEQKEELYERIKKLQAKLDRNLREHDQQKKQLNTKIYIMKDCVDRIKNQANPSVQKINIRTSNISLKTKIYQIKIQPSREFNEKRIEYKPQFQKQQEEQKKVKNQKISALTLKNEIRQLKKNIITNLKEEKIEKFQQLHLRIRGGIGNGAQAINRKERINTERILAQKQKPRMRSKDFGKEMDYKKLDEMINQLRRQNRQLSEQRKK